MLYVYQVNTGNNYNLIGIHKSFMIIQYLQHYLRYFILHAQKVKLHNFPKIICHVVKLQ